MNTEEWENYTNEILKLPEIQTKDFRLLWYSNYWDGMYTGMLLYNDKKYYFSCFDEASDHANWIMSDDSNIEDKSPSTQMGWYRRFSIIELTDEEMKEEIYWHDLFFKYVGTYSSFDENGKTIILDKNIYNLGGIPYAAGARPPELHHLFFDEYKKKHGSNGNQWPYQNNPIIGWFHN